MTEKLLFRILALRANGLKGEFIPPQGRPLRRFLKTLRHSWRVAVLARKICQVLKGKKSDQLLVFLAGLIHDIGKAAIPDIILDKPGSLSKEEFEWVKLHPLASFFYLQFLPLLIGETGKKLLVVIALHHEHYEKGHGYPLGIQGEEIPALSRILTGADILEALTSNDRSYRKPLSLREAIKKIEENSPPKVGWRNGSRGRIISPQVIWALKKIYKKKY